MDTKLGDVVYIAYPTLCCKRGDAVGTVFMVNALERAGAAPDREHECVFCKTVKQKDTLMVGQYEGRMWCEESRVKKFKPLEELDGMGSEEELFQPSLTERIA